MHGAVDEDLRQDLEAECQAHLDAFQSDLSRVGEDPSTCDPNIVASLCGHLHNLKGAGTLLGNTKLGDLGHSAANVLQVVRDGKRSFDPRLAEALFKSVDCFRQLLAGPPNAVETESLGRQFAAMLAGTQNKIAESGPSAPCASDRIASQTFKSLVVEDELTSRLIMQDWLSRLGVCHVAVNGLEAVQAFELALATDRPYDLICMDILMPEMDGQTAVKKIRALQQEHKIDSAHGPRIVMTTAVNDVKAVAQAFGALCDGYLLKPVNPHKLKAQLNRLGLST